MPKKPDLEDPLGETVTFLVPCRPNADASRLEAVLRACGVVARVELPAADDARPEWVVIAVIPAEAYPDDRPPDLLAIRSPHPGFAWDSLPASELAAALADEFGPEIIVDNFFWTASGWVDESAASEAEHERFDRAAAPVQSRPGPRIASTGTFDPLVLRLLARNTPALRVASAGEHVTVWSADPEKPYDLFDGVPAIDGVVTFEVSRFGRSLTVAGRRAVHLRRWPAGAIVTDPAGGFEPEGGRFIRFDDDAVDTDPNDAARALRLDDEQASLFRALWRRREADSETFAAFSKLLRLPPLAADLVEQRAEAPLDATTVQPGSALRVFRDEVRGLQPMPGWLGAWQRFSARHPLLRWAITALGIALPAALIVLHHTGVRESPVVVIAYVAVALWLVDAFMPRKDADRGPSSASSPTIRSPEPSA